MRIYSSRLSTCRDNSCRVKTWLVLNYVVQKNGSGAESHATIHQRRILWKLHILPNGDPSGACHSRQQPSSVRWLQKSAHGDLGSEPGSCLEEMGQKDVQIVKLYLQKNQIYLVDPCPLESDFQQQFGCRLLVCASTNWSCGMHLGARYRNMRKSPISGAGSKPLPLPKKQVYPGSVDIWGTWMSFLGSKQRKFGKNPPCFRKSLQKLSKKTRREKQRSKKVISRRQVVKRRTKH